MSVLVMRVYAAVVRRLGDFRRGATAVEYGLILALIVCACITAFTMFSSATATLYTKLANIAGLMH